MLLRGLAASLIAGLVGCSTAPVSVEPAVVLSIPERESRLAAFKPWRALGSISVVSEAEGNVNASFSWDSNDQGFSIRLFGPLGIQSVQLTQDPNGALLRDRGGEVFGETAEQLLLAALGVQVPLQQMQTWAVGLPGEADQVQRDEFGRLENIVVAKDSTMPWNVMFERYSSINDLDLPRTVVVDGEGIRIKLSFKKWIRSESSPDTGRLTIPGVGT